MTELVFNDNAPLPHPVYIAAPVPERMLVTSMFEFEQIDSDFPQPASVRRTVEYWMMNSTLQVYLEPGPEHVHGMRWPPGFEPCGFDEDGKAILR